MTPIVEKIAVLSKAVDEWRRHYATTSFLTRETNSPDVVRAAHDRRRTVVSCMAATLILHDRAVVELSKRRDKIRADFAANGMILPGHRLVFVGERPISIPVNEGGTNADQS